MGGDLVTIEPTVLKVDEDVKDLLEKASLLEFFRKFLCFNESISVQVAETWEEGRVIVNGLKFSILE